jgi:UDP-3-O-[3-hydroxymyristoyl] glucosamine N-acyltransferase
MTHTLLELARQVGGEVVGDGSIVIARVSDLEAAGPGDISFYASRKYRKAFEASRASAVVVEPDEAVPPGRTLIRAKNAYLAFAKISTLFHPPREPMPEVAPEAVVHPTAKVHPSAQVMPLACVGPNAVIGARSILFPGAVVCEDARVGEDCFLYPNVVVRERCVIGDRVILQPGCVVGSDGFGFAFDPVGQEGSGPRHYKFPQVGNAVIEDDVELGANACVDRAAIGSTVVGRGTKVDNLVQIAHNVQIGPLSILCAQVGIAGSTRVGAGFVAGGQAGVTGHVEVGDGVKLAAQSGVIGDVPAGEVLGGTPARPHAAWMRSEAALTHLTELAKKVRELEKKLTRIEEENQR